MTPETAAQRPIDTAPAPAPTGPVRRRPDRFWTCLLLLAAATLAVALAVLSARLFVDVHEVSDTPERSVEAFLSALLDPEGPEAAEAWLCSDKADRDLRGAADSLAAAAAEHGLSWSNVTETGRAVGEATVTADLSTRRGEAATWTFTLVAEEGDPQWLVCDIDHR